jgi:cephalosporin-C deacetylase-like acetyl esterase
VVEPEKIRPSAPCPDDFDAFWKAKVAELKAVPMEPRLEKVEGVQDNLDYYKITMNNIRGTHIQGQLARPRTGEKFPALLIVQWAGVYPLEKGWVTGPAAEGFLVLNVNAHDLPIDQPKDFYQKQSEGPLKDYPAQGCDDREKSYFLRMYLSAYRGADYLASRPDWDGRMLAVTGTSQGGLQTIMIAGLHPQITAGMANVPAGCDHTGSLVGRLPGWPQLVWSELGRKDQQKVLDASRYYDVVNFAARIKCPMLVSAGLIDQTCPPEGVLAACNQFKGPKEVVILPKSNHMGTGNAQAEYYHRYNEWRKALLKGEKYAVKP